jgi:alkylation response protein AidB-like acyl-CoA dehydrogenase
MLLEPSSDQEFFQETTAKYLAERVPVDEIRRLRADPAGFDDEYWRGGADLGWTSLLLDEAHGGGTISGEGLVDLSLIAFEFGRHAAPGPLVPANVVAAALAADGDRHADLVTELLTGGSIASWAFAEPGANDRIGDLALEVRVDGDDVVVAGRKRPVESAAQASHLLVTGRTGDGITQVLVPTSAPGVTVEPMRTVDLTRRFSSVTFDAVRVPHDALVGAAGAAGEQAERQLQVALATTSAEAAGAMQAAFDMTVEWSFDRYTFGRPLASYQELKHRFADMLAWLEASKALGVAAVRAVELQAPDANELASVAKAFIGDYGAELLQDCVQMHGGIGLTFEHDLHLFLRRVTVDRALYGTPAEHRQRIATMLENRERT